MTTGVRFYRWPAWTYQRYRPVFDRLGPALGMAGLFVLGDRVTGVFPIEWQAFIAGGVLLAGLLSPTAGYLLFVAALALPLYAVSVYVAALGLSVLVLAAFLILPSAGREARLAGWVLVLATPLLTPWRLHWAVPLLAGLWWGEWGGVLVGVLGAAWLKLFAGMCGAPVALLEVSGRTLAGAALVARFHTANSLQTLLWMGSPLAPDSLTLLAHVLEMVGWGLAGYGVGLARRWVSGAARPSLALLAGLALGVAGEWAGSVFFPLALGLTTETRFSISFLRGFLVECVLSAAIVVGVYWVSRYLTRPVVSPWRGRKGGSALHPNPNEGRGGDEDDAVLRPWAGSRPRDDEQADIIMIDLG